MNAKYDNRQSLKIAMLLPARQLRTHLNVLLNRVIYDGKLAYAKDIAKMLKRELTPDECGRIVEACLAQDLVDAAEDALRWQRALLTA